MLGIARTGLCELSEDGEKIPLDGLSCRDPGIVSFVMCTFVLEFRKVDSEKYPPATIRNRLSGGIIALVSYI